MHSTTKINRAVIDEAAKTGCLKLIIRAGVGVDNIDVPYANKNGIEVKASTVETQAKIGREIVKIVSGFCAGSVYCGCV